MKLVNSIDWHEQAPPIIITLIFCVISFVLHDHEGTMFNQSNELWAQRLEFVQTYYPISSRHFTTYSILFLTEQLNLSILEAFKVVQLTLFCVLGVVFYQFLRVLKYSKIVSNIGLLMLLTSYPILCAWFIPVYTWADIWVYIFLALTFMNIFKGNHLLAAVFMSLACLAREPSMIMYPIYAYAVLASNRQRLWIKICIILLPFIVTGVNYIYHYQPIESVRFHNFDKNFLNPGRSKNTAYSLIMSFGAIWLTSYAAMILVGRKMIETTIPSIILVGAAVSIPLHLVVIMTMTLARETKLFFPMFIFLIPLSLTLIEEYKDSVLWIIRKYRGALLVGLLTLFYFTGQWFAKILFPEFDFRGWLELSQFLLGIQIALSLFVLVWLLVVLIQNPPTSTDDNSESKLFRIPQSNKSRTV